MVGLGISEPSTVGSWNPTDLSTSFFVHARWCGGCLGFLKTVKKCFHKNDSISVLRRWMKLKTNLQKNYIYLTRFKFNLLKPFFCRKMTWKRSFLFPIPSRYGIFTYMYHKSQPNVGKYIIHGWYGSHSAVQTHYFPLACSYSFLEENYWKKMITVTMMKHIGCARMFNVAGYLNRPFKTYARDYNEIHSNITTYMKKSNQSDALKLYGYTFLGTNISHQWKKIIIFPDTLISGIMFFFVGGYYGETRYNTLPETNIAPKNDGFQ